jgi:hypothetical protein
MKNDQKRRKGDFTGRKLLKNYYTTAPIYEEYLTMSYNDDDEGQ